jgi:hypothetical protein
VDDQMSMMKARYMFNHEPISVSCVRNESASTKMMTA